MRSFEELEADWLGRASAGPGSARVVALVQRLGRGEHRMVRSAQLDVSRGLIGDRWDPQRDPGRDNQVTVMSVSVVRALLGPGAPEGDLHLPGDNVLVDMDLDKRALPVGTRLAIGECVVEISPSPHAGCAKFSARFGQEALRWVNIAAHRERRLRGVNCRIVVGGIVRVSDEVRVADSGAADAGQQRLELGLLDREAVDHQAERAVADEAHPGA